VGEGEGEPVGEGEGEPVGEGEGEPIGEGEGEPIGEGEGEPMGEGEGEPIGEGEGELVGEGEGEGEGESPFPLRYLDVFDRTNDSWDLDNVDLWQVFPLDLEATSYLTHDGIGEVLARDRYTDAYPQLAAAITVSDIYFRYAIASPIDTAVKIYVIPNASDVDRIGLRLAMTNNEAAATLQTSVVDVDQQPMPMVNNGLFRHVHMEVRPTAICVRVWSENETKPTNCLVSAEPTLLGAGTVVFGFAVDSGNPTSVFIDDVRIYGE
jgi:hypothetical protein